MSPEIRPFLTGFKEASALMVQYASSIVIFPDTVAVHDGEVLEKQSNVPQPNSLLRRVRCSSSPGVAVIGPEQSTTGKNLSWNEFSSVFR